MRRKPGTLVPLEAAICDRAAAVAARGMREFHGYELAKQLAHVSDSRLLTGYGTLYRALSRLESMGLLRSRTEDAAIAAREKRPPRRLYTLTAAGEQAAAVQAVRPGTGSQRSPRRRVAPA